MGSSDAEGRCHGNEFWDAICYNWLCGYFSCMIDSDTMFDSGSVFGVKLSNEDIAKIECLRVVAMATIFGIKIAINWLCVDDSDKAIGYEGL